MSFKSWATIITFILLAVVIFFAWDKMVEAWGLLGNANLWILLLLIPVQFFSYYAVGEIIFSYLRAKGNLENTSRWQMARMALELNFVNHILPSGGAAGFSYMGWVLHRHGVSAGRATMAQIVRFVLTFVSFVSILLLAVVILTLDHKIDRVIITISVVMAFGILGGIAAIVYIVGNYKRVLVISGWLTRTINSIVRKLSRGKKHQVVKLETIEKFFVELHEDFLEMRREKKILIQPLYWSIGVNVLDTLLLFIAFLSLGYAVNPATLFIAFGVSSVASLISVTPGGAGVYEAIMIAFLSSSGVPADIAIAGTLLARVTLVVGTIVFGYVFYQLTISKYGKISKTTDI